METLTGEDKEQKRFLEKIVMSKFVLLLLSSVSLVNKAVVDYFFVEIGVEKHFEVLRHFLLMEDGEFAQSLSDRLFEKVMFLLISFCSD